MLWSVAVQNCRSGLGINLPRDTIGLSPAIRHSFANGIESSLVTHENMDIMPPDHALVLGHTASFDSCRKYDDRFFDRVSIWLIVFKEQAKTLLAQGSFGLKPWRYAGTGAIQMTTF